MSSALRRSESLLCLPGPSAAATPLPLVRTIQHYKDQRVRRRSQSTNRPTEPLTIRVRPDRELHARDGDAAPRIRTSSSLTSFTPRKAKAPCQIILPSRSNPVVQLRTPRTTSPLSPIRAPLPGRPVFPRSKPEPNLYKIALKHHMRSSPGGLQILHMGPRLAMSIMTATEELERLVADSDTESDLDDPDVPMPDLPQSQSHSSPSTTCPTKSAATASPALPVLTTSWVIVRGNDDWEMVDSAL